MKVSDLPEQSLIDHLTDLRKCLISTIIIVVIGFIICWFFNDLSLIHISEPTRPY